MQHLIKKNRWECLLYSFAMALDTTPELLTKLVGHDGSLIVDSNAPEPKGRRGFHVHEFTPIVLALGRSCTPVQIVPVSNVNGKDIPLFDKVERRCELVAKMIHEEKGVLLSGKHAMAFSKGVVFDPDGAEPFSLPETPDFLLIRLSHHKFPLQEVLVIR